MTMRTSKAARFLTTGFPEKEATAAPRTLALSRTSTMTLRPTNPLAKAIASLKIVALVAGAFVRRTCATYLYALSSVTGHAGTLTDVAQRAYWPNDHALFT
eukprot:15858468-Heterocapsa_arctica.AAC.1